jgi:FAD/FMN-containing dehydrogenase
VWRHSGRRTGHAPGHRGEWARSTFGKLAPLADDGVYVNNLGVEGADRVKAAYGANYDRLLALKTAYDPTNFFRLNQNIRP